jgi:hypothetical protein
VNANVRGGVRTRHNILFRKLLRLDPTFAQVFDQTLVHASGLAGDVKRLGESLASLIEKANAAYGAKNGKDLFKPTNKTVSAIQNIQRPVRNYGEYRNLIGDLYFVFWESVGERLGSDIPASYSDVNALRTDLEHDVDHGKAQKVAAKRKKISKSFQRYSGGSTPSTLDPEQFVVFQVNLLSAIESDTKKVVNGLK